MPITGLTCEKILELEFNYAASTAEQALNDRTSMINLFFLLVGGTVSIAGTLIKLELSSPLVLGLLFLSLAVSGFSFVFKLIRLRQAWRDSAKVMNRIKDVFKETFPQLRDGHAGKGAFLWSSESIPAAGKPWSLTFNLALLIVFLDSIALSVATFFLKRHFHGESHAHASSLEFAVAAVFAYLQERFYCYHLPHDPKESYIIGPFLSFLSYFCNPCKRDKNAKMATPANISDASPDASPRATTPTARSRKPPARSSSRRAKQ